MASAGVKQRTEEWYRRRVGRLSASRIAPLMIGGPVSWNRLLMELRQEQEMPEKTVDQAMADGAKSYPMRRGIALEPVMIAQYEIRTGLDAIEVGLLECPEFDGQVVASPDWLAKDGDKVTRVGEGKVRTSDDEHRRILLYGITPDHYAQVHCQMWCAEVELADYVSYCPDYPDVSDRLHVQTVPMDKDYMEGMRTKVAEFLQTLKSGGLYTIGWTDEQIFSTDLPEIF